MQLRNPQRANVLGVGISAINLETAEALIDAALQNGVRSYICVTSAHGVIEAQRDPQFRTILNRSFLTTPDGTPTVWLGRLQGYTNMSRVFGPDLMVRICQLSRRKGYTQFLYGGAPGVAQDLKTQLEARFPGLRIVGTYTPPYRPLSREEGAKLVEAIGRVRPDVMWVGLSTPKQERYMAEYSGRLETKLMIGVGAAFDYHTGRIKNAPQWVKDAGLQWLHRLVQHPKALFSRYLITVPAFAFRALAQVAGLRKYPAEWDE